MKETNIKLFPVLDGLCGRTTPSTPASFRPDLWTLQAAVSEYEMEERTFYWLPRSGGGLCVRERDVFLRGSHGHRVWISQRPEAGEEACLRREGLLQGGPLEKSPAGAGKEAATPERRPSSMKPYKTITLRLDAAHYARLTETARTAGLKIEPMLRQLIMGVNLRPRPPDTYAALLRELNAIGNNVNQLAYQANARGAATQDEIREAARLVRQAVRLVRDTL